MISEIAVEIRYFLNILSPQERQTNKRLISQARYVLRLLHGPLPDDETFLTKLTMKTREVEAQA